MSRLLANECYFAQKDASVNKGHSPGKSRSFYCSMSPVLGFIFSRKIPCRSRHRSRIWRDTRVYELKSQLVVSRRSGPLRFPAMTTKRLEDDNNIIRDFEAHVSIR